MSNGNVKCPVHGEHGMTANGKCWYCVQAGLVVAVDPVPKTSTTVGRKRRIT